MGYKAKCKYCGKSIDTNSAYKIVVGKTNRYYCNEEEYNIVHKAQQIKDDTYNLIYEIFGRKITNTILQKEINELYDIYSFEKIEAYLSQNTEYLSNLMQNKSFQSEYAQIRYFAAILKNSLSDFKYEKKEKINIAVEIDMPVCTFKRKSGRKALIEFEEEVGEEVQILFQALQKNIQKSY